MLATESAVVCIKSPEKIADDLGMLSPLSRAVPWLYSMAPGWSAPNSAAGTISRSTQLNTLRKADMPIPRSVIKPKLVALYCIVPSNVPGSQCLLWPFDGAGSGKLLTAARSYGVNRKKNKNNRGFSLGLGAAVKAGLPSAPLVDQFPPD